MKGAEAITLAHGPSVAMTSEPTGMDAVASVVIEHIPVPSDITPWESIEDFRNDPASIGAVRKLRIWMRRIAEQDLTVSELNDELGDQLSEYRKALRIHRMKTTTMRLEVIVTAVPTILQHLVRLEFGSLAKPFFSYREKKVALLEAERSLPGRELAYIVGATERFDR